MFTGLAQHKRWLSTLVLLSCQLEFEHFFLITDPFYGETGLLQNTLAAPHTHRCHGKVLSPDVDYSYPCLQARTATSCRQEPHIQGQFLPLGNMLIQQTLSCGQDYWNDNSYIFRPCRPQTDVSLSDLVFYFRLLLYVCCCCCCSVI